MTAQEKAQDLYQMYYECLWHQDEQSRIQNAKQGALIAVDEALAQHIECYNKMKQLYPYMLDVLQSEKYKYWEQVKQEIEKL